MTNDHMNEIKENRFILALVLTGLIFLVEFIGGFWTGSLALLSDSAYVFMDAFALGLSYLAIRAAKLPTVHLAATDHLSEAHLVTAERFGRRILYHLNIDEVEDAMNVLQPLCQSTPSSQERNNSHV